MQNVRNAKPAISRFYVQSDLLNIMYTRYNPDIRVRIGGGGGVFKTNEVVQAGGIKKGGSNFVGASLMDDPLQFLQSSIFLHVYLTVSIAWNESWELCYTL